MNYRQNTGLNNFWGYIIPIYRFIFTFLLIFTLSSCAEKAGGQDVSIKTLNSAPKISQVAKKFLETAPPEVIQALSPVLESYQPQVTILTPSSDEILVDDTVEIRFQVQDLPIFKDPQWQLGPHLHVILDNEPYIAVYDLNKPLLLKNLSAGTHTLRVFASRPWYESFKNEGAYAQMQFHVLTKSDDNNPDPNLPLLTYSRPNGGYGAEPIMLDFYLTNAPLHIATENNPEDTISDWRIRCTINGESFILDRWETVYLKGFKPGKNWVKLEFLDNQGNPVKNIFNSTVRMINYQPDGKDTLSKIVRGEVTADDVRGIADPNYTTKIPVTKPTPAATPKAEIKPIPQEKVEETPTPEITTPPKVKTSVKTKVEETSTPEITTSPKVETEVKTKVEETSTPEITTSPKVETEVKTKVEETPTPEITTSPKVETEVKTKVEETSTPEITTSPKVETEVKTKVEETSTPEITTPPKVETEVKTKVEETPTPEITTSPKVETEVTREKSKPQKTSLDRLSDYFDRKSLNKTETLTK
ncbi:hypothetical protein WJM97_20775 [Okeanomitos corallinicola TIOX110]|uniref:FHA domain containing protein n=1 Tax=Okeanomitos corallinicola TIOX110 TaxID=3133117 RepID=A0ABZ2URL7_9CYAN